MLAAKRVAVGEGGQIVGPAFSAPLRYFFGVNNIYDIPFAIRFLPLTTKNFSNTEPSQSEAAIFSKLTGPETAHSS
jgi:hypothetical protein